MADPLALTYLAPHAFLSWVLRRSHRALVAAGGMDSLRVWLYVTLYVLFLSRLYRLAVPLVCGSDAAASAGDRMRQMAAYCAGIGRRR